MLIAAWEPLNGFLLNLIFGSFAETYQHISFFLLKSDSDERCVIAGHPECNLLNTYHHKKCFEQNL